MSDLSKVKVGDLVEVLIRRRYRVDYIENGYIITEDGEIYSIETGKSYCGGESRCWPVAGVER